MIAIETNFQTACLIAVGAALWGAVAWCERRARRRARVRDPFAEFARRLNAYSDGACGFFFIDAATAEEVEAEARRLGLNVRFERRPGCRAVRVIVDRCC